MDETLMLAVEVAEILERLEVPYFVGGSLASSQYGVPRATLDADLIARLASKHVKPLIAALGDDWYADEGAIQEAVAQRSSFNLVHLDTAQKVDVFVAKDRPFENSQFLGATRLALGTETDGPAPYFASAAHSVLAKLEWYRIGGESSDRQWNDVLGVIEVQGSALDRVSMSREATLLGVADLLEKAFAEAEAVS